MFNNNVNRRSDNLYNVEPLEPRRFLSVTASDGAAPEEPAPAPTDETYSSGSWGDGSDSAPVDQSADDGTFSTTDWGDGSGVVAVPTLIYSTGIAHPTTKHSSNSGGGAGESSPLPAQAAGSATPADIGAVTKSVLGISDQGVLN